MELDGHCRRSGCNCDLIARVREDERAITESSDDYTVGYAKGQADMRRYLLADDTHSYTYGYREGRADAARDVAAMPWAYRDTPRPHLDRDAAVAAARGEKP